MLGLMIGNAAMHKPFGIENGLGCAAQAVLIYADTTLFARSFYKPSAPVSHTDNGHTEKKITETNTKKKTNCGGDNHSNNSNSNSQGSTRATTIRTTTTGNYQTTAGFARSLAAAENGAQRQPQTELQAQRNNEPVSTIRHSGESAKPAK